MAKGNQNNQVNLNVKELKNFLTHIVQNNRFLQQSGKSPVSTEIAGDSGLGKTSAVLQLANTLGLNVVKLNLAQIEELGDLVGFPVRQFQLCKNGEAPVVPASTTKSVMQKVMVPKMIKRIEEYTETEYTVEKVKKQVLRGGKMVMEEIEQKTPKTVNKQREIEEEGFEEQEVPVMVDVPVEAIPSTENCRWVDEQAVEEYLRQGYAFTGEKRMSYCPPEWIATKVGGGILILDDWNRGDIRFIQAVMELVDRQEYISWKLPKDWHIMLTANPDNGDYLVNSIDTAQRTRFVSVNLKWDVEVWAEWAEKEGIDSRCINFVLKHPETITARVNPRSISTFFNCISSIEDFAKELPLIQMIGEGSVGPEFSVLFTQFINNKLDKLINPKDILLNESESYVVGALKNCVGRGKEYRADIASIITTRICNFGVMYSEKNPITPEIIQRLIRLMTDEEIFTNDLQYVLVKKFLNGNKAKFQKILLDPKVVLMSTK
jgi:MoxR-like ATPase